MTHTIVSDVTQGSVQDWQRENIGRIITWERNYVENSISFILDSRKKGNKVTFLLRTYPSLA